MRAVFWLLTSTVPRVGRSMSAIKRSSVLLPAPDGPVRNTNSPRSMLNDTPRERLAAGRVTLVDVLEPDHDRASPSSARTNSSARNSSRSATPSPTATSRIGTLSWRAIASRMPPFAVPSSFVMATPVSFRRSWNLQRLRERVLTLARVEHEQDLVRRRRVETLNDALDLLELVHEPGRRMQPARGVGEHDVDAARARRDQRVVDDGRGIGARGPARRPARSARSPHSCSCSTAAARNVSAAASSTV